MKNPASSLNSIQIRLFQWASSIRQFLTVFILSMLFSALLQYFLWIKDILLHPNTTICLLLGTYCTRTLDFLLPRRICPTDKQQQCLCTLYWIVQYLWLLALSPSNLYLSLSRFLISSFQIAPIRNLFASSTSFYFQAVKGTNLVFFQSTHVTEIQRQWQWQWNPMIIKCT